jgi:hypothetical protein
MSKISLSIFFFISNGQRAEKVQSEEKMRSPGFEPGSSAWEADVLARLDYDRLFGENNAENSVTC